MRKYKMRKGFTLVELMIASALLLIIIGAVVPQFRAIRNSLAVTEKSMFEIASSSRSGTPQNCVYLSLRFQSL